MIVPMKRVDLLFASADRAITVDALGRLGVLHLDYLTVPGGATIEQVERQWARIERALRELPIESDKRPMDLSPQDAVEVIWAYIYRRRLLRGELERLEAERERVAPFGHFDPALVRRLADRGIHLSLFALTKGRHLELPEHAVRLSLGQTRTTDYLAVVHTAPIDPEIPPAPLPEMSIRDMDRSIARIRDEIEEHNQRVLRYSANRPALEDYLKSTTWRLNVLKAHSAARAHGTVSLMRGYCPEDALPPLHAEAQKRGWAVLVSDPSPGDKVPTLVRRPAWVRPIGVVFDFIKIIPGYREPDISAAFLVFLSLFFAMIVGDAGYGALFLLFTAAGWRLAPAASHQLWRLLLVMSLCTIVWGVLTGTYFGLGALPPVLRGMRLPWLLEPDNIMLLCFFMGAVHLTVAHAWNAVRWWPAPGCLAQAGWIGITWVMFFTARSMVLGASFPALMIWVLGIGVILVLLFMTPLKQLKKDWINHAMLPLGLVGNFVDVVSYVRLFAVGMATFAMASAFNQMAADIAAGGPPAMIGAAALLFLGHALNILLATMGVLVHGIRLNTLEFSGHLGMGWTGRPYRPFGVREPDAGGA